MGITQLQLRLACARSHKRCQQVFEGRTAKPQQCVLQDMHGAAADILEVLDKDIGQASFRWYASFCVPSHMDTMHTWTPFIGASTACSHL